METREADSVGCLKEINIKDYRQGGAPFMNLLEDWQRSSSRLSVVKVQSSRKWTVG